MGTPPVIALLRDRNRVGSGRVGMVELFFDLVFVFAVTQLSHTLLEELTLDEPACTCAAVPGRVVGLDVHRLGDQLARSRAAAGADRLFVLMLIGLFLSVSIPHSFAERGIVFAVAYVTMQVGRTLFVLWAVRRERRGWLRPFSASLVWLSLSGVFWIVGGFAEPAARLAWWTLALGIELFGPWACATGCRGSAAPPPRTGTSTAATWPSAARCSSSSRWANRCSSPARRSPS